jgi:hypothetical protein
VFLNVCNPRIFIDDENVARPVLCTLMAVTTMTIKKDGAEFKENEKRGREAASGSLLRPREKESPA